MRLSDGFLQAAVGLPEAAAPSRVPQAAVWSGRRQVALPPLHRVPSKGALALSHQEPSPHCILTGLCSLLNLCPPPQPSHPNPSKTGLTKFTPVWRETPATKVFAVLVPVGLEATHKPTAILLHSPIC